MCVCVCVCACATEVSVSIIQLSVSAGHLGHWGGGGRTFTTRGQAGTPV